MPAYRPWVGVVMSLLVPGGGLFLAGRRRAGVCWFVGLSVLGLLEWWGMALPIVPGLWLGGAALALGTVLWLVMLVQSWRPIDRLRASRWVAVVLGTILFTIAYSGLLDLFAQPMRMPSGSMLPTLQGSLRQPDGAERGGDCVLVLKTAYWLRPPRRGDVIVFRSDRLPGLVPDTHYLKRVVGLPGERIQIMQGRLHVDGQPVGEPAFLRDQIIISPRPLQESRGVSEECLVPPGHCFLLGDNTGNSYDSRAHGAIPVRNIIGRVTKIYWPWSRAGNVR